MPLLHFIVIYASIPVISPSIFCCFIDIWFHTLYFIFAIYAAIFSPDASRHFFAAFIELFFFRAAA